MKLDLQLGDVVQGDIRIESRNLMLVFQVNCPGCLAHALPLLNQIQEHNQTLNCFALSTAFEDFTLNNLPHTQALLERGELTLHSKRYFANLGQKTLPYEVNYPVVMDWFMSGDSINELAPAVINVFGKERLSSSVEQQLKSHLAQKLLPMAKMGRTFLNNGFQGTPTWVYFDQDLKVLESWFGHKDYEWVKAIIAR